MPFQMAKAQLTRLVFSLPVPADGVGGGGKVPPPLSICYGLILRKSLLSQPLILFDVFMSGM